MSTLPSQRSSPQAISHIFLSVHNVKASISLPLMVQRSSLKAISYDLLSVHNVRASVSLPPNGALHKLFPAVSCPSRMSTLPSRPVKTELSPSYFPHFPVRPQCKGFHLAPSHGATKLSQSYFLRSPVCPQCPRFRLAPSQRSSPQAISRGFLPVQDVHASVSLPQNGALPKLFPTVSCPSTKSTLPSRSLPTPLTDLSPGYFPIFSCPRFRLAASQRSFLQAISHYWVKVVTYGAVIFLCRERCDVGKSMIP